MEDQQITVGPHPMCHPKSVLKEGPNWEVQLIGNDGKIRVSSDAMPLILFSPLLKECLREQWLMPFPTVITVPDYSIQHLRLLVTLFSDGAVYADKDDMQVLQELIAMLNAETPSGCVIEQYPEFSDIIAHDEDQLVGPPIHKCDHCSKMFRKAISLRRHLLREHPETTKTTNKQQKFMCTKCSFITFNRANFRAHKLTHESSDSEAQMCYQCPECGKSFKTKSYMAVHMRIHKGEKPYSCELCSKKFAQRNHLQQHMNTHAGERKFVCPICQKGFVHQGTLNTHYSTVHLKQQLHQCEICSKKFGRKQHLDSHMFVHTGVSDHKCDVCGKMFMNSGNLKTHIQKHHSKLSEEAETETHNFVEFATVAVQDITWGTQ